MENFESESINVHVQTSFTLFCMHIASNTPSYGNIIRISLLGVIFAGYKQECIRTNVRSVEEKELERVTS